ncbi:ferric iron uptake transcriptional regulator [Piscinibacter sp. XHJ-5]|uniref:ferric iron uptake transcriptional regulator n=1 Tax=Piscinibacter sp. XHJ-5 TaxID=3037797 RepID=UPI00245367EE|nr:ferric iron uptake transcriptional regulator [Piscinibacter sp. XHJ-5]
MDELENLRHVGLKATQPRLRVLEIIRTSPQRHLSADEVYKRLVEEKIDIGLATVYRVLGQLEHAGILSRSSFDSGKSVFEIDEGTHHDHMVCVACGRVDEFHDAQIEERQRAVAAQRGFSLQEHRLALYGLCSGCRTTARAQ